MTSTRPSSPDSEERLSELGPGDMLGERYRIEGLLGGGGIGAVYRAVQLPLERPVAIKVLHDDLLSLTELRARFEREARVLSALTHPHVVSISDYGIDGDRPYLVTELLEGRTLEQKMRDEEITPEVALDITHQMLEGLAFAHAKGVSHRDLKPANVFMQRTARDDKEHVKLLDFGLAGMVSTKGAQDDEVTLTKRGVVFGTPAYMSPEQAAGSAADQRSDLYSMGVLLFELLAGRRPFVGETRAELLRGHLADPLPRLASVCPRLRAHEDLVELLDIATAKTPTDRYPDAGQMLFALEALPEPAAWLVGQDEISVAETQISVKPTPLQQSRLGLAIASGALAAMLAIALVFVWAADEPPAPPSPHPIEDVPEEIPVPAPSGRATPRDPWEGNIPEPFLPYHAMVEDGHVFAERREIAPLYALARAMPDDPRPFLLLGHLFFTRGWYTDAIRRYEHAVYLDETVRGDPRVLDSLLVLVARESVSERAADAVVRIYGAEALAALGRAIEARTGQALPQLRLVRLRTRLDPVD